MSRRSGGNENPAADTTRSPMRMRPSVTSSNPAMQRSVVVLPQPLGPSRTSNSASAISRSIPPTAVVEPYRFTICSRRTRVIGGLPELLTERSFQANPEHGTRHNNQADHDEGLHDADRRGKLIVTGIHVMPGQDR